MLIAASVFLMTLGTIAGSYWLFVVRPEAREQRVLQGRVGGSQSPGAASMVRHDEKTSAVRALDAVLARRTRVVGPIRHLIGRSGIRATVGTIVLASAFCALTFGLAVAATGRSVPLAIGGALLAGWLPVLFLKRAARRRLARIEELFPEAMDLLARALRAGHALPAALKMVADEMVDPIGAEFRLLYEQQNYGMSLAAALRSLAERVPLLDARFFVTAVLTQAEAGGNMSEVLDNLAHVIRERFRIRRQVRAISAHGRMTGLALACLPPGLAAVLTVIAPQQIRLLVFDPLGVKLLGAAVILQIVGGLAIRRIVNVEY